MASVCRSLREYRHKSRDSRRKPGTTELRKRKHDASNGKRGAGRYLGPLAERGEDEAAGVEVQWVAEAAVRAVRRRAEAALPLLRRAPPVVLQEHLRRERGGEGSRGSGGRECG